MEQGSDKKITYLLEMASPGEFHPSQRSADEMEVTQIEIADAEFNWFLHQAVGAEFRWGGREDWGPKEWTAYVDRPELETWVAYISGTPAGYYELERQDDGSVRIECFGLRRQFFGQGFGGPLLTKAVRRCWEMGANRVWLTTCSHDHLHALKNYLARGFKLIEQWASPPNPPRQSALFTRSNRK